MKKLLALIMAAAMLLGCAMAETTEEAVDEAAVQIGTYNILNQTGETVVFLSITDNVTGDSLSVTYPEAEGLENEGSCVLTFAIDANEDGHGRLTFAFKTASGYEGSFATLSIEEAGITLLAADAMTGPTQIAFTKAEETQNGVYTIRNTTGMIVTEVTLSDNVTGSAVAYIPENGMENGEETTLGFGIPAGEDGHHRLTLHFTVQTGETEFVGLSFDTLSIEEATIELLSPDAASGATPIHFAVGE